MVLLVDDDGTCRYLAREALESVGIEVDEAVDGMECVQRFAQRRYDLVLLDLFMPGMDGFQTCSELRKAPRGQCVPIVLLTGVDDLGSIQRAYEMGVTDFIQKPINGLIFAQRIRYILKATGMFKDLQQSEALLQSAQRLAHLGSWEWEVGKKTLMASDECCRIYELPLGAPAQAQDVLQDRIHPSDRSLLEASMASASIDGAPFSLDFRLALPSGKSRHVHTEVQPIPGEDGKVTSFQGAIQDVSEIKEAQERIQFLAHYDCVTGLANRTHYLDTVRKAIAQAQREKSSLGVLFIDLDRFKRINDTFGHDVGDILLRTIGDRLESCVRRGDTVSRSSEAKVANPHTLARLGGDEFAILLHDLKYVQSAAKVAQRILEVISIPVTVSTSELLVTASIGISVFPSDGQSAEDLLKNADTAMYSAKAQGKNNYQFFSSAMSRAAATRMKLEAELRHAIEDGKLRLHYQPKVEIATGELAGCEALLRWKRGQNELASPGVFADVAEEAGLMHALDEWVLREACLQARSWQGSFAPLTPIAVNVSDRTFNSQRFVDSIRSTLAATGTPASSLEIELTEQIVMQDMTSAISKVKELQALGVKTAIDDFGTGHSSLAYLKDLSLDYVKIDRSFIKEITTNHRVGSLARAIVAIGHALDLKVIAEGVETEAQLSFLGASGYDMAQGYLMSRPVDPKALEQLLVDRDFNLLPQSMLARSH